LGDEHELNPANYGLPLSTAAETAVPVRGARGFGSERLRNYGPPTAAALASPGRAAVVAPVGAVVELDDDRPSPVTLLSQKAAARRRRGDAAAATEIDDFSVYSANSSRQDACRPPNRSDTPKHRLFCNLERRAVEFIASLAAA
jgi:hypothetical protein